MLKKTISYVDILTNEPRTEDFYFNLTKAEAVELNVMEDFDSISKSTDPRAIIPVFKRVIKYSYGVRTPDGKFTKDERLTSGFLESDAYSNLFLELLENGEAGVAQFIQGVLGMDAQQIQQLQQAKAAQSTDGRIQPQDHQQKFIQDPQPGYNNVPQAPPSTNIFERPQHESGPGYEGPPPLPPQ